MAVSKVLQAISMPGALWFFFDALTVGIYPFVGAVEETKSWIVRHYSATVMFSYKVGSILIFRYHLTTRSNQAFSFFHPKTGNYFAAICPLSFALILPILNQDEPAEHCALVCRFWGWGGGGGWGWFGLGWVPMPLLTSILLH